MNKLLNSTALLAALPAVASAWADVVLEPGKTEVVIAPRASETVRYAADEMTNWLARAFGASVPIVAKPFAGDGGDAGMTSLVLGENEWSKAAGLDPSKEPHDAFFIDATAGNRIYIVGRDAPNFGLRRYLARGGSFGCLCDNERGTVHGVYAFLEQYAGIRFYWPDDELGVVVPHAERIVVPAGRTKTVPDCLIRDPYFNADGPWYCATDPAIDSARLKAKICLRLRQSTTRLTCCHGILKFKLRQRFEKTHPEFFPHPKDPHHHLCWTNPDLREIIYQDVKKRLLAGEKSVDIMPDDAFRPCPCARCQAAYEKEKGSRGYASRLLWGFVAEVGNRLIAEGVKGDITMMSYSPYEDVPDFPLPKNVRVMVAVYGPWSLTHPDYTRGQYDRIRAWKRKTGADVWIWTYPYKHGQLAFEGVPQMAPHAWAKFYQGIADAIFGSFAETESDKPFYNYLNYYVFSRIMWDKSADVEAILAEHDRLLYGPAAADMRAFNDQLEKAWTERVAGTCFMDELGPVPTPPCALELWTSVYSRDFLKELRGHLDAAAAKVKPGSLEAKRIALVRREFYLPLEKVSEDFRRGTDIEVERAYRAAHPENVNIMAGSKIDLELPEDKVFTAVSTGQLVRATASMLTEGARRLKPNTRYRISFFLKLDNVQPVKAGGGVEIQFWDARNNYFPGRGRGGALVGTTGWIAQHYEIKTDPKTNIAGPSYFRFHIRNATGRFAFNAFRIDELPDGGNENL